MPHTAKVPADHPCLPGHFPGNPVVPAVVLLEEVQAALSKVLSRPVRIAGLPAVKFLRPLAPDIAFEVALDIDRAASTAAFRCSAGGHDLVTGRLSYAHDG
jgi:3-hydroxyacyl-[acyl-carrier-protein] dehydratase